MAKKTSNVVNAPEVVNMDDLALATDAELLQHVNKLYTEHVNTRQCKLLEIEIAYCQREMGIRNARFEAHVAYMNRNNVQVAEPATTDAQ